MNKSMITPQSPLISPLLQGQLATPYLSPFVASLHHESAVVSDLLDFQLQSAQACPAQQLAKMEHIDLPSQDQLIPIQEGSYRGAGEEDEAVSLNHSQREQFPSTKFVQIRQEYQPPFFLLSVQQEKGDKVQAMIEFLVEHSELKQEILEAQSRHFSQGCPGMRKAFMILAHKFKKLHKTKQQMTKYCMRKAFKFIAQSTRKDRPSNRDLDNCMRQYFCQNAENQNFTIPFKKHSTEKTMNGAFLKRVFGCDQFLEDYREFLGSFQGLMAQDNSKKIAYLSGMVQKALEKGEVQSIGDIRRLPWTVHILRQVNQLAVGLATNPQQISTGRRNRRQPEKA